MTGLLDQVMDLPARPEVVAELEPRRVAERECRQRFYEPVPDGAKREFINGEIVMHWPDMVGPLAVPRRLERISRLPAQP